MSKRLRDADTAALQRERARKLQEWDLLTQELQLVQRNLQQLASSRSLFDADYIHARDSARTQTARWQSLFRSIEQIEWELQLRRQPLYPSEVPLPRFSGDARQPLRTQTNYVASLRGRRPSSA